MKPPATIPLPFSPESVDLTYPPFHRIVTKTAAHFGVAVEALRHGRGTRNLRLARSIAIYLCRQRLKWSLTEIGDAFARDHTSVLYAVRKIEQERGADPELARVIDALSASLEEA